MATGRPIKPELPRQASSNRSAPTPPDNRTPAQPRGAARSLNLEAPPKEPGAAQKRERDHEVYHAAVLRHFRHSAGRFYGGGGGFH
jgi:hypothetical protein